MLKRFGFGVTGIYIIITNLTYIAPEVTMY